MYVVCGLSKGGTVSIFDRKQKRLVARHAGLVVKSASGVFASQEYKLNPTVQTFSAVNGEVGFALEPAWRRVKVPVFTPFLFLAFRAFNISLGRLQVVSQLIKRLLVFVLIRRKGLIKLQHRRRLSWSDGELRIEDEIEFDRAVKSLSIVEFFTAIHMGSAAYPDIRAIAGRSGLLEFAEGRKFRLVGRLGRDGVRWESKNAHD